MPFAMLERLRRDPLRALILLERFAIISSLVVDVMMAIGHINGAPSDPRSLVIFVALFLLSTILVFSCPHAPHRRYWIVALAIISVGALAVNHTAATTPVLLLVILGTRLTFAFGLRGAAIAWGLTILAIVLGDLDVIVHRPTTNNLVQGLFELIVFGLVATLLFGLIGIMWLYARKSGEAAAASERTRIALDLHDSLGHSLTTLTVHLQNAISLQNEDPHKTRGYLERAGDIANETLDDVRETVTILHGEGSYQRSSVVHLLDQLRRDFTATRPIALDWFVHFEREPQGRSAMALYRIVQEALTNIIRHAEASHVAVRIESNDKNVSLRISDNGRGFEGNGKTGHGLLSMRSRVESLSGTIAITSSPGTGTTIDLVFPIGENT